MRPIQDEPLGGAPIQYVPRLVFLLPLFLGPVCAHPRTHCVFAKMSSDVSKISRRSRTGRIRNAEPAPRGHVRGPTVDNNNSSNNHLYGPGTICNNTSNVNYIDARPAAPPIPLVSDVSISVTLPVKPTVLHGREDAVSNAVRLLCAHSTARLAILGPGGMGKTTIALAILYDPRVIEFFRDGRLFLSCEALVDADAIVVSLAKLFNLLASSDLLTAVVARLAALPRVLLVLDNLETVWLAGGAPVAAVDELLGRLAQIPSLSLIITCRGTVLPQLVDWSNENTAVLEPFSLEAALRTFQDRSGRNLTADDEEVAKRLLHAVDRMPLAVSLLGQLVRRGNTVSELLERWNREHSALLQTYGAGRTNNIEVSVQLSIKVLCASDESRESLYLLSLCSMLPDGLRPAVFDKLRPQFKHVDRAKDSLIAYALASLNVDGVLKTLNPVRHVVLEHHAPEPKHRDALHSIYFDIAAKLPVEIDEHFKRFAAAAAPEMGNLSSLLLTLVNQPSQQIVDAVINFTVFSRRQQPTVTVASALLLYLEPHPKWKAHCLMVMGHSQGRLSEYKDALQPLNTALELYLQVGDRSSAAQCTRLTGDVYRVLGEYGHAETALKVAQELYTESGDELEEARCRLFLGQLMYQKQDHPAAIEHLSAAQQTFNSLGKTTDASSCSDTLGMIYFCQGSLDSAAAEMEAARAVYISLGNRHALAQNSRFLSHVRRSQGNENLAEQLLEEAEAIYNEIGDWFGIAGCTKLSGYLRWNQGRLGEANAHFSSALRLYETLKITRSVKECRECIEGLESRMRHASDDSQ